jgi:hypothetical protein
VTYDKDALLGSLVEQSFDKELCARDDFSKRLAVWRTRIGVDHHAMLDARDRWRQLSERMPLEQSKASLAKEGIGR